MTNTEGSELESDDSRVPEKEGARRIWGDRNDPDEFSHPLATVMHSLEEITEMIDRAEKAERAVCSPSFSKCFGTCLSESMAVLMF